jgi:hypothetical protein
MARVTLQSYLPDMKAVYGAIQQQVETMPTILDQFLKGNWNEPRWYECGAEYKCYNGTGDVARCRKYVGHSGRHSKRPRKRER